MPGPAVKPGDGKIVAIVSGGLEYKFDDPRVVVEKK